MARRIVINGRFLTQPTTGVQRYAREIVSALDALCGGRPEYSRKYRFEVLTPAGASENPFAPNMTWRVVGKLSGHMWEQIELPGYADNDLILNFANTAPLTVRNQIVTIHDASVFAAPDGYSLSFRLWYKYLHRSLCRRVAHIVTDSIFSQSELERYCGLSQARSTVIALGAEHILREPADKTVLGRSGLGGRKFVLCAGSLNPNKNLASLVQTANQLESLGIPLVVAGGGNERVFRDSPVGFPANMRFLGYVTDSELRALYESAVCFVFPSRYEGFGLPPLEAMACRCPVVCSHAASLQEVCSTAALMCDAREPAQIADSVLSVVKNERLATDLSVQGRARADTFVWAKAAQSWLELIDIC